MDDLTKDVNDHAGAESGLNAGLGLIGRLREWCEWSESQAASDLAKLLCNAANEIERLRGYFEYDANCPCCQQSMECEDGCTFSEDAPADYEKMIYAREILMPNV